MRKLAIASVVLVLVSLAIDARELHWRELAVQAELANDGTLHVVERHALVFTGDWNGGERVFRIEPHQTFTLHSVRRVDADGVAHDLAEGDLSAVDHFGWTDAKTLRWRSRATSDPEFDHTEIVYLLDYTLGNILLPNLTSGGYTLDHDFAFADRNGVIQSFTLDLTLGTDWIPERGGRVVRARVRNLLPNESYLVTMPLGFRGAAKPGSMSMALAAANLAKPWMVSGAMLLALLAFLVSLAVRSARIVTDKAPVDAEWVQRNVLRMPPEVAGTFLHGEVGAPEFAALLARMEQDGQIRTWTTPKLFAPTLHLELLVPTIHDLDAPGQALASKVFGSAKTTSTEKLREKFKYTGFDPAGTIRPSVLMEAQRFAPVVQAEPWRWPGVVLLLASVGFAVYSGSRVNRDLTVLPMIVIGGLILFGIGLMAAQSWGKRRFIPGLIVLALLPIAGLVTFVAKEYLFDLSLDATIALTLGWLGAYLLILANARDVLTVEGAGIRRMMRRARRWFRRELRNPHPALRDTWTPWLIAFGLHRPLASWSRSYGTAASSSAASGSSMASASSMSSSSTPVDSAFTGGGGSFGGAGATGTWGIAAMSMAAGVAAPSSSGSSGGYSSSSSSSSSGGSSGSSGGGGGGGW